MKKTKFQFLYSRLYASVLAEFSQLYLYLSPYLSTPESVLGFDLDDDLGNKWTLTLSRRNISSPNRAFLYAGDALRFFEFFSCKSVSDGGLL